MKSPIALLMFSWGVAAFFCGCEDEAISLEDRSKAFAHPAAIEEAWRSTGARRVWLQLTHLLPKYSSDYSQPEVSPQTDPNWAFLPMPPGQSPLAISGFGFPEELPADMKSFPAPTQDFCIVVGTRDLPLATFDDREWNKLASFKHLVGVEIHAQTISLSPNTARALRDLKWLSLNTRSRGDVWTSISQLPALEYLAFDRVAPGKELSAFAGKRLKYLSFRESPQSESNFPYWLAAVETTPGVLTLKGLHIKDADLAGLENHPEIEGLNLAHNGITDEGLKWVAKLPNLKTLKLQDNTDSEDVPQITPAGIELLKGKQLVQLTLPREICTGKEWFRPWYEAVAPQTALWIPQEMTDEGLALLSAWPDLETLSVHGEEVTDAGIQQMSSLSKLRTISVRCERVTDVGLQSLADLPLFDIGISSAVLTDRGISELSQLQSLRSLNVWNGRTLTDEALGQLSEIEQLETLTITDAPLITDHGLLQLADSRLLQLHITDAPLITHDAVLRLKTQSPNLHVEVQHSNQNAVKPTLYRGILIDRPEAPY